MGVPLVALLIATALAAATAYGVLIFTLATCLGEPSDSPPPAWAGCESTGFGAAILGGPAIGLLVLFAVAGRLVARRHAHPALPFGLMLLPALAVLVSGFALLALL